MISTPMPLLCPVRKRKTGLDKKDYKINNIFLKIITICEDVPDFYLDQRMVNVCFHF